MKHLEQALDKLTGLRGTITSNVPLVRSVYHFCFEVLAITSAIGVVPQNSKNGKNEPRFSARRGFTIPVLWCYRTAEALGSFLFRASAVAMPHLYQRGLSMTHTQTSKYTNTPKIAYIRTRIGGVVRYLFVSAPKGAA